VLGLLALHSLKSMRRLALVTCVYDLAKRGSAAHRTIGWLMDNAAFVLGQDRELVIFTDPDPELEAALRERRCDRPTKIVAIRLEELLRQDRAEAITCGVLPCNANATKDKPAYVQLTWSKFAMLEKALEVTSASHIGWIDFSITHVAKLPPSDVDVFANPSDAPHVHVLRCFGKGEVDHPDYWRSVRGHLAAGLIAGSRDAMCDLAVDFWRATDRAISMGLSPLEEGLLSYVVGQRPRDFSYSYGDYADILCNHDTPRGGDAHRAWIVADARSRGISDIMGVRQTRYVHDPARGSSLVSGFPSAILGYSAENSQLIVPGRYERDLVDWSLQLSPTDKQFVDIGAHAGSWTLVMAMHFREVHAFEPQRLIYQQLCGNIALNGLENVFARNVGIDEAPGRLTLYRPGVDRGSSSARSDVAQRFEAEHIALSPETIDVVTLDSFADVLTDVGLVKIDVEGLELRVLRGASKILEQNGHPKLLVECWSSDWYRQDKEQLLSFLDDIGYRVVTITGYSDMLLAEKK
jgi:FkbM family methyltransferase